jgi:hypothetical protein
MTARVVCTSKARLRWPATCEPSCFWLDALRGTLLVSSRARAPTGGGLARTPCGRHTCVQFRSCGKSACVRSVARGGLAYLAAARPTRV